MRPAPADKSWIETERLRGDGRTRTVLGVVHGWRRRESRKLTDLVGVRLLPAEHARAVKLADAMGLSLPALFRQLLRDALDVIAANSALADPAPSIPMEVILERYKDEL